MEWTRTDYIKISPSTYDEVALPLRRKMDYAINVTKMSLSVGGKKKSQFWVSDVYVSQ